MKIKCNGQDILSNNFTDKDKRKLDSVQPCANYYKHPIVEGYKHLPAGGTKGQVVTHNGTRATWEYLTNMFTGLEEVLCYGVPFDMTVADPPPTRRGNMSLHTSLPIQSQLKGCIAQGGKIIYWLNESDWRFRKEAITKSVELTVAGDVYTMVADVFNTLQYDKQWVKVDGVACQISSIDTSTNTATLLVNDDLKALSLSSGTKDIELGAVLNGYDGTVRVYCPAFYIKSVVNGNIAKVWLSTVKIDDTYTYQPAILIDAYRSVFILTSPYNRGMGYLSNLQFPTAVSIVNTKDYCRGGSNDDSYDKYLATDPFRTHLGKPSNEIHISQLRPHLKNSNIQIMRYDQYKNIFYWLYVVEYANFNSQEAYNPTLTDEGYHQGGMGDGITNMKEWYSYNSNGPIIPCGYGNTLGNGTGLVPLTIPKFNHYLNHSVINEQTMQMPRWRGFDNPFGEIGTVLDGILVDIDTDGKGYIYTCQDANKYDSSLNDAYVKIGEEIYQDGYIKSFDLGDAAHIIPHVIGGDSTQYICDYHKAVKIDNTFDYSVIVGGSVYNGSKAGLGYLEIKLEDEIDFTYGFRTVSNSVSFPSDK